MKEYTVTYVDKKDNNQTFELLAANSRQAISSTLELCTDCKRVIRCSMKPMFEDE